MSSDLKRKFDQAFEEHTTLITEARKKRAELSKEISVLRDRIYELTGEEGKLYNVISSEGGKNKIETIQCLVIHDKVSPDDFVAKVSSFLDEGCYSSKLDGLLYYEEQLCKAVVHNYPMSQWWRWFEIFSDLGLKGSGERPNLYHAVLLVGIGRITPDELVNLSDTNVSGSFHHHFRDHIKKNGLPFLHALVSQNQVDLLRKLKV